MPVTYTNRKGITYTLFRTESAAGARHVFALKSRGEPVDELPPGYHISESPNGIVTLVKERPELIRPREVAAVEEAVARHPHPRLYRVNVTSNQIAIYAIDGPGASEAELVAAALIKPARVTKRMREIDERLTRYVPVLRFTLHDRKERTFRAEGRQSRGYTATWRKLGPARSARELARALVPNLGAETPFGFYPWEMAMPWSDWLAGRAGYWSPREKVTSVHRLTVTLLNVAPPIWRRIEVPSHITLAYLHEIVQETMGWLDMHLHEFRVGDVGYGDPRLLEEQTDQDARKARLKDVAPRPGTSLRYVYDFGDHWEHEILVEAVERPESGKGYPICLAGERACPPEDSGGAWGYSDMLKAIADRRHPMHDDYLYWLGGPFDPEAFDLEQVNGRLAFSR